MALMFFLSCFYFYLPAALANIGASLTKFTPFFKDWKNPIDGGKEYKGHRLVGAHKTWGGFAFGVLFGFSFALLKYFVLDRYWIGDLLITTGIFEKISLALLLPVSALLGDSIKSVIKRLVGVKPHSPWIPFDEIDHSTFSMLMVKIAFPGLSWSVVFSVIVIFFFLHLVTNNVAFVLKLKKVPY